MNILKLQNGSDIRGIALENDNHDINLTDANLKAAAYGILEWLKSNKSKEIENLTIAIGMDSRLSGPHIKSLLSEVFVVSGVKVIDCDMATTPAMFMATILKDYRADAGIMITASHLPYYYNGIKLFTSKGGAQKADILEILTKGAEILEGAHIEEAEVEGVVEHRDLVSDYANILVNKIKSETQMELPFKGMRIIVDAGNGAGGFFADKVIKVLGGDIQGSQYLDPDGNFPNHIPNPENKEAMESISKAVKYFDGDLGIIFDTDVDRAAIVAKDGSEINRNLLIGVISAIILRDYPNSTIVTDSITSTGLGEFIHSLGGVHHRFKRGYKNVINESIRLNEQGQDSQLAIETSGHAALKENHFLDDGAYLIAKILIEAAKLHKEGKTIDSLIKDMIEPAESSEYRLKIKEEEFGIYGAGVLDRLKLFVNSVDGWHVASPNFEGVKVITEQGWFLLRMSLHEPVMPLNIEGDIIGSVETILAMLKPFIEAQSELEF